MPDPATGRRLREMRQRLGLSQVQLAELLETSQQTLSEQERGVYPVRRERLWALRLLCDTPLSAEEFAEIMDNPELEQGR